MHACHVMISIGKAKLASEFVITKKHVDTKTVRKKGKGRRV